MISRQWPLFGCSFNAARAGNSFKVEGLAVANLCASWPYVCAAAGEALRPTRVRVRARRQTE